MKEIHGVGVRQRESDTHTHRQRKTGEIMKGRKR